MHWIVLDDAKFVSRPVIDIPPLFFFPNRSSFGIAPQIVIDEVTASGFEMLQLQTDWPGRGPFESYCAVFRKPERKQ